ncbi:alanine racemase, partial [Ensifer sp. P24N7]|uniref:alanine racemase n=1 Tax=Sinorhizobium sp. P24N7 TaxID=3348358 RepID=UPI0035F4B0AB
NEQACANGGIIPVVNSLEQWRRWAAAASASGRALPAVLQFDTGMSRLGVSPEDRDELADLVKAESHIDVLFVMSHLASADDVDSAQNGDQRAEMETVAAEFSQFPVCFATSGGIFLGTCDHGALVRPGVARYGGAPTGGTASPRALVVR